MAFRCYFPPLGPQCIFLGLIACNRDDAGAAMLRNVQVQSCRGRGTSFLEVFVQPISSSAFGGAEVEAVTLVALNPVDGPITKFEFPSHQSNGPSCRKITRATTRLWPRTQYLMRGFLHATNIATGYDNLWSFAPPARTPLTCGILEIRF